MEQAHQAAQPMPRQVSAQGQDGRPVHIYNHVERITITGGLIGLIGGSPRGTLQKSIERANEKGWHVRQVMPDQHVNLVQIVLRLIILILTLLLYTPGQGFLIVYEQATS